MSREISGRALGDLEQEFASHLLYKDAYEYFVKEGVTIDLLYSNQPKAIFRFVHEHFEQAKSLPTWQVLHKEFPDFVFVKPDTTPHYVVDKLRERFRRKLVQDTTKDLARLYKDDGYESALEYMKRQVYLAEVVSGSQRYVWSTAEHKYFADEYAERQKTNYFQGWTVGFNIVDQFTGGLRPGNLAFLLARPKRGKTFFLGKAFIEQIRQGKRPAFFTLELTETELFERLGALLSGISYDDIQKGRLTEAQREELRGYWTDFTRNHGEGWILRPPPGQRTVPQLTIEADKLDADCMLVDQFSFLEGTKDRYYSDHQMRSDIVYDLKRAASRSGHERPIYCAAQFNREAAAMEEMGDQAKAALTDAIGQAADSLYAIHRSKEMFDDHTAQFGVIEARAHDIGKWMISMELRNGTYLASATHGEWPVGVTLKPEDLVKT